MERTLCIHTKSSGRTLSARWAIAMGLASIAGVLIARWLCGLSEIRVRERQLDEDIESTMDASDPIARY
ncbi:MAG TPA: hypothetical protein PLX06_03685 [Fimbriimonadaceae bacterium]|nr:hypothetical protein [Fimbriimonadaceae bacterium]